MNAPTNFTGYYPIIDNQACRHARLYLSILAVPIGLAVDWLVFPNIPLALFLGLTCVSLPWLVCLVGWSLLWARRAKPAAEPLADHALPRITILLPVHQEANMMAQLADMLGRLDYPIDKLQCLVLMEAEDTATLSAALAVKWPSFCQLLSMPRGQPTTKARACNYALNRTNGELLVIFDAEDRPHAEQLRAAAACFAAGDGRLACLQAPLRIQPDPTRWQQCQFALEYGVLFEVMLPGLSSACAALPLGGSSNYFRVDVLRRLNGWDSNNLTEDADLGIRLARAGYRTHMLSHPTTENAPHSHPIWHRQRTRWHSGHIQTLHMHAVPPRRMSQVGPWAICQILMLARLVSGPLHVVGLAGLGLQAEWTQGGWSPLLWGVSLSVYAAWLVLLYHRARRLNLPRRMWLVLTHPLYWMLTVLPLLHACKRMGLGQLSWLKSPHRPYQTLGQKVGQKVERVKGIEPSS